MEIAKSGARSEADWDEVMRNRRPSVSAMHGTQSEADWDEVICNPGVTAVTTMVRPNTAEAHDEKTDMQLLENMRRRSPWIKHILSLSRARVNGE